MTSSANSCSAWALYVIIDRASSRGRDLAELTAAAIRGGADVIQLRDKQASARALLREATRLLTLTRAAGLPLILNDRADVARAAGADGVHLGQEDLPLAAAREELGPKALIGVSTHSRAQAMEAQAAGADYIGFGPIFPTPTKPDYGSIGTGLIREVAARVRVPIVCIGGIDVTNLDDVLRAGARCVAVVRAVCGAADPEAAARALKQRLMKFPHATPQPHPIMKDR